MTKIGILLSNTGTPDAPTSKAVRRYLREFLADRRIVQLPRFIWLPILYGLILPIRPRRSAKLYQKIWQADGSPMRSIMQNIKIALEDKLNKQWPHRFVVELGMNYGQPAIADGINKLKQQRAEDIIVLPLFPQYSHTTIASTLDRVHTALKTRPNSSTLPVIQGYATHPLYIKALATSILQSWSTRPQPDKLLISFHGIPERFVAKGDPYQKQCEQTAQLLAEELQLAPDQWLLCFQSQFGYAKWLRPSTQVLFTELPKQGCLHIDVICPGFAVDCLETLEEIMVRGKKSFLEAGGQALQYIPALNASDAQVGLLHELLTITLGNELYNMSL